MSTISGSTKTPDKGSNVTPSFASVPLAKTTVSGDEWAKRGGSRLYRKRAKRMVLLLRSCEPQSKRATTEQTHYWLDSMTMQEGRRLRSPSERLADTAREAKNPIKV